MKRKKVAPGVRPSPGAEMLASRVVSKSLKRQDSSRVPARDGRTPTRLLLALLTCLTLSVRAATSEANVEKTFPVKPGGQLGLDVDSGPVWVSSSDRPEVQIEVKRKVSGPSESEAKKIFALHDVNLSQDGDRIDVTARFKKEASSWFSHGNRNFQVEYRITVPRRFNLELRTGAGTITADPVEGSVKAKTSGGNLKFGAIKGSFDGNTAAGAIDLDGATGSAVVKTSGGNINLGQMAGNTDANTAAGAISIKSCASELIAHSSGGNIDAGDLKGPAKLETAAGFIHVKKAGAKLTTKSSGGNIEVEEAHDTVTAQTAAGFISVGFLDQPHEDCSLTSNGGNIDVKLGEKLAFDIDARTSGGRVQSELPITMAVSAKPRADILMGKLNEGGKALLLKTSAGDITLKK